MTRRFGSAFSNFGLTISIKKTEVMHQPAPGAPSQQPSITVNSQELKVVDSFVYLGSTLTRNGQLDKEITTRIAKASAAFGRLNTRVWRQHGISIQTKLKVYRAVVVSPLLYGSESWTYYRRHVQQLEAFHQRKLRCLVNIKWQQRIPDTEILHRAKISGIEAILVQNQLRWSGHVCRMEDSRIPKQLLYGELCDGRKSVGGQRKRYKDVLHHNLLAAVIKDSTWKTIGQDRESWRTTVRNGVRRFEDNRIKHAKKKRALRKLRDGQQLPESTWRGSAHIKRHMSEGGSPTHRDFQYIRTRVEATTTTTPP